MSSAEAFLKDFKRPVPGAAYQGVMAKVRSVVGPVLQGALTGSQSPLAASRGADEAMGVVGGQIRTTANRVASAGQSGMLQVMAGMDENQMRSQVAKARLEMRAEELKPDLFDQVAQIGTAAAGLNEIGVYLSRNLGSEVYQQARAEMQAGEDGTPSVHEQQIQQREQMIGERKALKEPREGVMGEFEKGEREKLDRQIGDLTKSIEQREKDIQRANFFDKLGTASLSPFRLLGKIPAFGREWREMYNSDIARAHTREENRRLKESFTDEDVYNSIRASQLLTGVLGSLLDEIRSPLNPNINMSEIETTVKEVERMAEYYGQTFGGPQ